MPKYPINSSDAYGHRFALWMWQGLHCRIMDREPAWAGAKAATALMICHRHTLEAHCFTIGVCFQSVGISNRQSSVCACMLTLQQCHLSLGGFEHAMMSQALSRWRTACKLLCTKQALQEARSCACYTPLRHLSACQPHLENLCTLPGQWSIQNDTA